MGRSPEPQKKVFQYILPWLVLALLLTYTYASFFQHPYGFGWDPDSDVYVVFTPRSAPTIEVGDRVLQVGSVAWETYRSDLRRSLFEGIQPGQTVPVIVQRGGRTLTIPWTVPGLNAGEVRDQLFSEWFLIYVFWLVGTAVLLLVRPKDERWALLIAFNYLTAIWLSAGSGLSNYHIWYSALVLRMGVWLSVPVYLHLHWVFPRPLGKLPPVVVPLAYGAAFILVAAQWFQVLPQGAYFLGFLLALLGSLLMLILHAVRQPEIRRELRVIWIAVLFALAPLLAIAVVNILSGPTRAYSLALLSFPALPLAYLYAAYRRQLGGLEVRVNRLISAYLFLILLATVGMPMIAVVGRVFGSADATVIVASATGAIAALLSIFVLPGFRAFVERRWLGISLPSQQLSQLYSGRARSSTSIEALLDLLERDILPSLLIRQFLFLRLEEGHPEILLKVGVGDTEAVPDEGLAVLRALDTSTPLRAFPEIGRRMPWVRLILPLRVGASLRGYWFMGRRDPDDYYSQQELPLLQSLADQTAMTLSNITQTERLRAAYRANISQFEQERLRLALDLHDGILNRLAALLMKMDDRNLTPAFQDAYYDLVHHLRQLVKDLRPASLNYGVGPAIEELADSLNEASNGRIRLELQLDTDGTRYDQDVEQQLFRIAQEACTNAARHGRPTEILITGSLHADMIDLQVHDNGTGFDFEKQTIADARHSDGHFGLPGMFERAELIGAEIEIDSALEKGTSVRVRWRAPKVGPEPP